MAFLKEPVFHFALMGVAIFAWFMAANPEPAAEVSADMVVVDRQVISALGAQFEAKMNRAPAFQEIEALMDHHIRTEVMVREARSLGLDQGDSVVRNRLAQKMGFLATSAAQSAVPDDATLEKHLAENAAEFETGARISFQQTGLAEGLDRVTLARVAEDLESGAIPPEAGRMQLLPTTIEGASQKQVDGAFGKGFFAQLADLPTGTWEGPVHSGFGPHLVRVVALEPAVTPTLDAVREEVLFDWRRTLADQLTEAYVSALMEKYEVRKPTPEELAAWAAE